MHHVIYLLVDVAALPYKVDLYSLLATGESRDNSTSR